MFDEYAYTPPSSRSDGTRNRHSQSNSSPPSSPAEQFDDDPEANVAFEIPLNTLIECLNIFGTAGPLSHSGAGNGKNDRKWRKADDDDGGFGDERGDGEGRRGPIDKYFSGGKDDKRTGMRMSFAGAGYPLTLLMRVSSLMHLFCFLCCLC
jgi:cell cycle checkpoint protein